MECQTKRETPTSLMSTYFHDPETDQSQRLRYGDMTYNAYLKTNPSIRTSYTLPSADHFRGQAGVVVVRLGPEASIEDILHKLDSM